MKRVFLAVLVAALSLCASAQTSGAAGTAVAGGGTQANQTNTWTQPQTFTANVVMPEQSKAFVNAVTDCSVPANGSTDAYASIQACVNAHPSAHIVLPKTQAYGSCDYMISQTIMLYGAGQWISGSAGSPATNENGATKVCTSQVGVTAFWGNNQYAPAFHISDLSLLGSESWARATLSTFKLPFGWSYPSIAWLTGSTSTSTTLTTTAASELFLAQNVGQTVDVVAGGTAIGTDTCTTTSNNASATCTGGALSHVGQSIFIPGAGAAGAGFSATIIGFCVGTCGGVATGSYQLSQAAPTAVSGVTSNYAWDLYTTISSLSDSHNVVLAAAGSNNLTGLTVYVGSRADGVRVNAVKALVERVTAQNFGREGFRSVSGGNIQDMPYIGVAGRASDLSDDMAFNNLTGSANRGNGYYIAGGDVNVSQIQNSHFSGNQLWGYVDNSFLGSKGDSIDSSTNHQDCTTLPCGPSAGGTNSTTSTATLKNAVTALPASGSDWVCNSNTNLTTGGSTPFAAGQVGMIITLPGCGPSAATLVTTVAAFISSSNITLTDAASSTNTVTATARIWPTVTKTSGTAFSSGMVGKDISILGAGANGQALYTTIAQFYSATTVAINAAPINAVATTGTIYYGTTNYAGRDIWTSGWSFTSGAITSGLKVLTLTNANELFLSQMCSGATTQVSSPQIIVVGAGPGGTDLNTTCSIFTNSQSITLNTAAGTTVSGAIVNVQTFGGSYLMPNVTGPEQCFNCYGEGDQADSPRLAGPASTFIGGLVGEGTGTAIGLQYVIYGVNNFKKDAASNFTLQAGNTIDQQIDFNLQGIGGTTLWDIQKTSANDLKFFNSGNSTKQRMAFLQGSFNEFDTDQTISAATTETFRFKCGTGAALATCMKFDNSGDIYFHTNSALTTYIKLTGAPAGTRVATFPDANITVSGANVEDCGQTTGSTQACAKTAEPAAFMVRGDVQLNTATTQAITTLPFTSATSYSCTCSDATTAAGVCNFTTYTSGAAATIQESSGVNTDHLRFVCVGF